MILQVDFGIMLCIMSYLESVHSFGVIPVTALNARKNDDSDEKPDAVQISDSFMPGFCPSNCLAYFNVHPKKKRIKFVHAGTINGVAGAF